MVDVNESFTKFIIESQMVGNIEGSLVEVIELISIRVESGVLKR